MGQRVPSWKKESILPSPKAAPVSFATCPRSFWLIRRELRNSMAILLVPTWNKSLIKSSNRPPLFLAAQGMLFLAAQRVLFLAAQGALFLGAQRAHKPWCSAPTTGEISPVLAQN